MSSMIHAIGFSSPTVQALNNINLYPLADKWQKNMSDYEKMVEIAYKNHIDISQQTHKMAQVIHDLPAINEKHQFLPMRALYGIKMYERYKKEIGRKIAQNGLYHANRKSLLDDLTWQVKDVSLTFQKWTHIAHEKKIDVSQQVSRMQQVLDSQPADYEAHQFSAIKLLNEIKMRKIYCIQIICKIAESEIQELASLARDYSTKEVTNLRKRIVILNLIGGCEKFLLKMLPLGEGKINSHLSVETVEEKYREMRDKMEQMTEVISEKIQKSE